MSMLEKAKQRRENFAKHGITFRSLILNLNDCEPSVEELDFIEDLLSTLQAFHQVRECPCNDCVENFIIRARHLYRVHIKE